MGQLEELIEEQRRDSKNFRADTDGGRLIFVDPHFFDGMSDDEESVMYDDACCDNPKIVSVGLGERCLNCGFDF
jgi:hypothetical protein